ncbi:PREDICTED: interleukin-18 [Miniopterus natalensis]|uniref:interleukin-18 n=1 Tax=Miniopterus natalensis TaxID=291302 RepID=UPI0007A7034A|nr:PREDICTED: interleukin-18 [Miniopterus natalensis]
MAVEPVENDCIDFVKMKFIDNTLYFKAESDENLESDYFGKLEPRLSIIRNLNNQVLFVYQGKQPMFEDMTDSECRDNASQTEIIIYIYKDSNPRSMAVTLSVKCKTIFTLSCRNKNISFQEMSPPDSISGEENEMIFFMRSLPGYSSRMEFESSLYKEHFLACKKENDLFKLILKKKDEHGDQSVIFTVDYKD